MKHPEVWAVGQVPWQFFCTLTWANVGSYKRPPSHDRQMCAAFAFFREAAHIAGVHFKKSMWCLRYETGEITERDHFHCLLSALDAKWANPTTCSTLKEFWETKLRCGYACVRVFDLALGGVAYSCKDLSGSLRGEDRCEFEKFFESRATLTLSKSVYRFIDTRQMISV